MFQINRRHLMAGGAALLAPWASARSQAAAPLRIGVLADFSGPYRDTSGPTALACARQAAEDLNLSSRGITVEFLQGDHQNKPDVALAMSRRWIDQDGVDMICEVNNSAIALAVAGLVQEKNKVQVNTGALSAILTGERCSANTVHWTADTWMLANTVGRATVRNGGDSWFLIVADYAFGHQMERDLTRFVTGSGGRIAGSVRFPFPGTTDFASYLVQAQASRAKVVGLLMAGADMVNCIKQAREFGVNRRGVKLAGTPMFVTDIHALGLETAQGLLLSEAFYWDLNDRTRAFLERVKPKVAGNWPNQEHAGTYSGVLHYLKAVADMGLPAARASGLAVVERMKAMPTDDDCFGPGTLRADGRKIHPSYLFEVKAPGESRGPWDYYRLAGTVSQEEAFRPLEEGGCPLVKG
ncbi:ABC transporter substrate-binding protein [Teichococcus oryzae]|uniref:ABC transporter substrate-binding protein n=1 Tax=Teichococcus oryzae TaxID=1608942 RepID=A0A5B2TLN5_9PROT|nr:ABC transporter substrate-binding protein [Pseudoroseomonas oryzae]KAA2214925.1 ABC transporter substrate-binding protein [Pseudoroseomonas oryzae]